MIRLCVSVASAGMAANVGGPVQVRMRTFDIDLPELEELLSHPSDSYTEAHVCGAEVLLGIRPKRKTFTDPSHPCPTCGAYVASEEAAPKG
jgi:hypothetical protein